MSSDEADVRDSISSLMTSYSIDDRYARSLPPLIVSDTPFVQRQKKRKRKRRIKSNVFSVKAHLRYLNSLRRIEDSKLLHEVIALLPSREE